MYGNYSGRKMISCSAMFHFTAHRYTGGGMSSKRVNSCIQVLSSAKLLYPYIWLRSLARLMRILICLRQVHWHQSPLRPSVDRQARRLMDCFWHIAVTFLLFHTLYNWFDFDKLTRTFFFFNPPLICLTEFIIFWKVSVWKSTRFVKAIFTWSKL